MYDAIIIGAGIGGLTLGYQLHRLGKNIIIIEPSDHATGVIRSEMHDGFLLEFGPTTALTKPAFRDLITSLNLESRLAYPRDIAKHRYLAKKNNKWKLYAAPTGPVSAFFSPILSPQAKLRALIEPFIPPTLETDQDVHTFVTRRFGKEVAEHVVAALLSGIWAADISNLSARSGLPTLWEFEQTYGSIFRGGLAKVFKKLTKKESSTSQKTSLISFKNGMVELPQALCNALPPEAIKLNCAVRRIEHLKDSVNVHISPESTMSDINPLYTTLSARYVILTSPSWISANLIAPIYPALSQEIRNISYSPLGIMHVKASSVQHSLDGFGFLCPPKNHDVLLGTIFNSSLFEGRAPDGFHLLTCYLGGSCNPAGANPHLPHVRERALKELSSLIGTRSDLQILSSHYWDRAIPSYKVGHHHIENKMEYLKNSHPQIRFLSNWHRGIGVPDRIHEADRVAKSLIW